MAAIPLDRLALVLTGGMVSKPGVQEASAREQALLEAMRDHPEAGVVQWAKTTRCDKSAVSMRLGRLAKRGDLQAIGGALDPGTSGNVYRGRNCRRRGSRRNPRTARHDRRAPTFGMPRSRP